MQLYCHVQYDDVLLKRALALSLPYRKEKALLQNNDRVRAASLSAGLLLKFCLKKEGALNTDIELLPSKKPVLKSRELYFSLSHSGEYAVCITARSPVGIDIQRINDMPHRVARRFCTDGELVRLERSENARRDAVCLWALKESWLKAADADTEAAFNADFTLLANGAVIGPEGFCFTVSEDITGYITAVCTALK